jgi:hypothetical protein
LKIISWNLKNLGNDRLARELSDPIAREPGGADTVLGMITKVVMGLYPYTAVADNAPVAAATNATVDLFVIIELRCTDGDRNTAAAGAGPVALQAIVNHMNIIAAPPAPGPLPAPTYASIPPLRVSETEAVGIIYKVAALAPQANVQARALQANLPAGNGAVAPGWLNIPEVEADGDAEMADADAHNKTKAPFLASFTTAGGHALHVVGIHASPQDDPATRYCRSLPQFPDLVGANRNRTIMMGDFNICPTDAGQPFVPIFAVQYTTRLHDGTKTSLKRRPASGPAAPMPPAMARYLSRAYDNVIHNAPLAPAQPSPDPAVYALDLPRSIISPDRSLGTWTAVLPKVFNDISDHLPMVYDSPSLA